MFSVMVEQRMLFFGFKMGLPSSLRRASELSANAYVFSTLLVAFVTSQFGFQYSLGKSLLEQIVLFIGVSAVFVCWELSRHLHQALLRHPHRAFRH